MTVIKMLIGVAGVGKSTYIKQHKTEKSLVLSSDELRIELFGDLEAGNTPEAIPVVFKTLHERMKEALLSKQYDTIFYDATNLNRKLRKGFYEQFKKYAEIEAIVLVKPLATILEQNAQRSGFAKVPESVIRRMYESLQVPRISVDCDKIEVIGDFEDFAKEIAMIKGMEIDDEACFIYHLQNEFDVILKNKTPKERLETIEEIKNLFKEAFTLTDENFQPAMTRLHITDNWEKALRGMQVEKLAKDLNYSFSQDELKELTLLHKTTTKRIVKKRIEDLLTYCNFHYESSVLHDGDYERFL